LTAKYLKAENLPVIIFEKFKISDFLKNQNIIFDGSNLLTVKKPLLVGEFEDLMIYKEFYESPNFKIYKKFRLSNQQQPK